MSDYREEIVRICSAAAAVRGECLLLDKESRARILTEAAAALEENSSVILSANEKDVSKARNAGMKEGLLDRLYLDEKRIGQIAEGMHQVAALPDPLGQVLDDYERPNGMRIRKISVPMGVIGIIYESRPNVTADAFALCFKSGNVSILKGGSDALYTNMAIVDTIRGVLSENHISPDILQLIPITDRSAAALFMTMREYVDLLIPRGGASLIASVVENSRIPVIETGVGNCHVYVDASADLKMAEEILINAKTSRVGVCNAAESLVLHKDIADSFLPVLARIAGQYSIELRADERSLPSLPGAVPASEEDYAAEYLDLILSVKIVDSLDEAIAHINRYHTGHSDCIVTEDAANAQRFLTEIDSACVYHNVSTRFTDGFEFGFGAEIGISTQKLHARGPMGLKELTSYKYEVTGSGQVR
ncbi:MAG: glutamate-5-semialdehyde dehydrogenase [Lachnospiraceae bacterium]|nr:glutamate-5-semialdehyde dehydrogenase [Lachnospiraceae bacterium]